MLEKTSIRNVKKIKPSKGDRSKPISGGKIPRNNLKYGSVILPNDEKGWVYILIFGNHVR